MPITNALSARRSRRMETVLVHAEIDVIHGAKKGISVNHVIRAARRDAKDRQASY